MKLTLEKIFSTKKLSNIISNEYMFLKKTSPLYVNKVSWYEKRISSYQYQLIDSKYKCQLFYALDDEIFNEEKSIKKISSHVEGNKYEVEFFVDDEFDKEFVVFMDFEINDEKVLFDYFNMVMIDDKLVTCNNDPYIVLDAKKIKDKKIKITYCLSEYSINDVCTLIEKKKYFEDQFNLIINGRFFKVYSKLKKFLSCFKK